MFDDKKNIAILLFANIQEAINKRIKEVKTIEVAIFLIFVFGLFLSVFLLGKLNMNKIKSIIQTQKNKANGIVNIPKSDFILKEEGNDWSITDSEKLQNSNKAIITNSRELFLSDEMSNLPLRTNSWWKGVAIKGCDSYIYPFPYIVKFDSDKVSISFQKLLANSDTVSLNRSSDLTIHFNFDGNCYVEDAGQIDATIGVRKDIDFIKAHLTKGLPYLYIEVSPKNKIDITTNKGDEHSEYQSSGDKLGRIYKLSDDLYCGVAYNKNNFFVEGNIFTNNKDESGFLIVGCLGSSQNLVEILAAASNDPILSGIGYGVDEENKSVIQSFVFSSPTPYYLLPHHYTNGTKIITGNETNTKIDTIRGDAKIYQGEKIEVQYPIPNLKSWETLSKLTIKDTADLVSTLKNDIKNAQEDIEENEGVYWKGKKLSKYVNLAVVADKVGLKNEKQTLVNLIEKELSDWFTYSGENDEKFFYYDKRLGGLLSSKPEFGHENYNDHHFHYGYWIYTASGLSYLDPTFAQKYKDLVNLMVYDVAEFRINNFFPRLRTFDEYEGRSAASGLSYFSDGNNQESSSEAMNFWYACYLWGNQIQDKQISNQCLSGYVIEGASTNSYYFGINNPNIFPQSFDHAISSIIWDGKYDFATWFSSDPNAIYGIQIIPATLGSTYLIHPNDFYNKLINSWNKENENKFLRGWEDMYDYYKIINNHPFENISNKYSKGEIDSGNSKTWMKFMSLVFSE